MGLTREVMPYSPPSETVLSPREVISVVKKSVAILEEFLALFGSLKCGW